MSRHMPRPFVPGEDDVDGEEMGLHVSEVGPHDEGEEHTYEEGNWDGEDNENGSYNESGESRFDSLCDWSSVCSVVQNFALLLWDFCLRL